MIQDIPLSSWPEIDDADADSISDRRVLFAQKFNADAMLDSEGGGGSEGVGNS